VNLVILEMQEMQASGEIKVMVVREVLRDPKEQQVAEEKMVIKELTEQKDNRVRLVSVDFLDHKVQRVTRVLQGPKELPDHPETWDLTVWMVTGEFLARLDPQDRRDLQENLHRSSLDMVRKKDRDFTIPRAGTAGTTRTLRSKCLVRISP